MIKESLQLFIDNIKQKAQIPFIERNKTPFAGAFLISLVLYNWKLFYSLISFDESENRLTKISYIETYLNEVTWLNRVGFPILYAFASIVLFYIFSNISLGLSTIFNKWGKAIVLYFTDRSKIIAKQEYSQMLSRYTNFQSRYEDLRNNLLAAQSEISKYQSDIKSKDEIILEKDIKFFEKNNELEKISQENKKIQEICNEIEFKYNSTLSQFEESSAKLNEIKDELEDKAQLLQSVNNFRIIYARYGIADYNIVTEKLSLLLRENTIFKVGNKNFGPDPSVGLGKRFEVSYIYQQVGYFTTITEGQFIKKENNIIESISKEQTILELQKMLSKTVKFTGKEWIYKTYTLVHDYEIGKYRIAIDTTIHDNYWDIQFFGRDESSELYLRDTVIKTSFFDYGKAFSKFGRDRERLIFEKIDDEHSMNSVSGALANLLSRVEAYRANEYNHAVADL